MKSFRGVDFEHITVQQYNEAWPVLKRFLFDPCTAILESSFERFYIEETEAARKEKWARAKAKRALIAETRNMGKNR